MPRSIPRSASNTPAARVSGFLNLFDPCCVITNPYHAHPTGRGGSNPCLKSVEGFFKDIINRIDDEYK